MRNLRKLTAAVLAIALVLTSMTAAFAAETVTTPVNSDKAIVLNDLGLYAGISDKEFDPDLGSNLTRQQSTVLLLKMFGLADKAAALTKEEVATALKGYTDADKVSSWAKNAIAYAVTNDIMSGIDGTISPAANVTGAQFATLIVKTLGYDVADYKLAVTQLSKVTGSKVTDEFAEADLTRDGAVGYLYGTLTAQTKLGATVIANLVAATPAIADKAIAAGLYTAVNTTLTIDSVISVANNKVKVVLTTAAAATAADFAIVKKGTTTAVAVKNVTKESDTIYVLETEALVSGTTYTLTANAQSVNFTGIAADTSVPTIVKVTGADSNKFVIEFSDKMDFATGTDIANYTFDKSIKVVKATINSDRNKITLFTDAAKKNIVYAVTIQNVTNSDGKTVVKATRKVTATEDKIVPKLATLKVQNNRMLILTFTEASGLDKTSAETLSNYSINDLTVLTAKAYDIDDDADDDLETVVLTTSEQTASKSYTLTLENIVDAAVLANSIAKSTRAFRGATEDTTSPVVKPVTVKGNNNNTVDIEFTEANAMDVSSLEDISNYAITYGSDGDTLDVISAKAAYTTYPDAYNNKRKVTLTTSAQEISKAYKLEVKGVQDEFGNALKTKSGSTTSYTTYPFTGSKVITAPPTVTKVTYVSDTRVDLTFDKELKEGLAEDPTNYSLNKDIGAPVKANLKSDDVTVELTTQELSNNTTYTITINNVEDLYGNAMQSAESKFVATSDELDSTTPSINYIQASNTTEIEVNFDESIPTYPTTITLSAYKENADGTYAWDGSVITFTAMGRMDDGKTVAYYTSAATPLIAYTSYKIVTANSFKDDAGNALVYTTSSPVLSDRYSFDAVNIANEAPTVEYIEQINVKKLKVVFSEPVSSTTLTQIDTDDDDDYLDSEWYYKTSSEIPVDKDITIDFSNFAKDANNTPVQDYTSAGVASALTTFRGYLEDDADPVITGVESTNNKTIVVTYDEDCSVPGSYKLYKLNDTSGNKEYVQTVLGTIDDDKEDNTVSLAVDSTLYSATTYYLQVVSGATDIAGNKEDASTTQYDFPGSDVVVSDYIKGVSIVDGNTIKVSATKNMTAVKITTDVTVAGTTNTTTASIGIITGNDDDLTVELTVPVLSGKTYTVSVTCAGVSMSDYTFTGSTPDLNIGLNSVTTAPTTSTLDFVQSEMASYNFFAYLVTDNVVSATPLYGTFSAGTSSTATSDDTVTFTGTTKGQVYYVVATRKDDTIVDNGTTILKYKLETVVYAAEVIVD